LKVFAQGVYTDKRVLKCSGKIFHNKKVF